MSNVNENNKEKNAVSPLKKPKVKRPLKQLPTQQLLQQIQNYLLNREERSCEKKRWIHYCCFLLCWKTGLRISEAISFDYQLEHPSLEYKNLYLLRGKGSRERYIYVGPELIRTLVSYQWKPELTNRVNFFTFLQRIKRALNIPANIELAPHTLRRCFATYNAISGMPLPVLQKVLGHSKISTTALYVKDSDLSNLLKFKPI